MRKKRNIIISIVVLLLVVSVGYALFSDTLNINGTATAKGDFSLSYECEFVDEEMDLEFSSILASTGTGSCSLEKDNIISTTSTLSKPSDQANFLVTVTNTGSIPAKLIGVTSPNNYNDDGSEGDEIYADLSIGMAAQFYILDYEQQPIIGNTAAKEANITLQPGEKLKIAVSHFWGDLGENQPKLPDEGATMDYNLTFDFEQITNN